MVLFAYKQTQTPLFRKESYEVDDRQLHALEAKLDTIIRLLAAPLVGDRPIADSAPVLSQFGLENNQIATILSTTPNVVRTAIARAGKSGRAKRR